MSLESKTNRPVLICDAMNLFVRSYSAYPTMSSHGYQMGGCIGFLKTLQRIVYEVQPSAVYIAWEGGGSSRRRALYSEYKLNRRPEKLNRFYESDIPDTEENRKYQIISLLQMIKCAPACQIYVSDCEGDDVIAYLCRGPFRDQQKVIVSSDKDFYQLLDNQTKIYSLHKKTFIAAETVFNEFRIQTHNFAVAKALCGDSSDNVPGVKGLGFKTVTKLFPFLGTKDDVLLQDVFDYCHAHIDKSVIYRRIIDNKDDINRNWKLVHLDGGMLSAHQITKIDHTIAAFKPAIDRMGLLRLMIKDGVADFDIEAFFYSFHCIENLIYRTKNSDNS